MPGYDLAALTARYATCDFTERVKRLFADFPAEEILVTSSFGTTSAMLLHLVQRARPGHPVYFLDTGYHFAETQAYRQQLTEQLGLNVITVRPEAQAHAQTASERLWEQQADACCSVNKVAPLQPIKAQHTIWLSGLMAFQNENRKDKQPFEQQGNLLKVYPLLDVSPEHIHLYRTVYGLPLHPLEGKGYGSVGCTHCTQPGKGRLGRWAGSTKNECGLHR